MKKIFVLAVLALLITGCTTIQKVDLGGAINNVLADDVDLHNQTFSGYEYYLPREVSLIDKFDYNTVLLYKQNKMYLYVDVISYYHKVNNDFQPKNDIYFSQVLDYNGKKGYINVTKEKDDVFYIEMEYNYGKIETYSNEENLISTVVNACYILRTLKYNDIVIESLIGENQIEYKEEKYDLFESESVNDYYLGTADSYEEKKDDELLSDDDKIHLDDDDELNN